MRVAITLTPPKDQYFKWAAQIGVTDYVARYPRHYGEEPIDGLSAMRDRAGSFGLKLSVVEGYLPIDKIVRGEKGRDEQIVEVSQFIKHMGKLGVGVLCYNFMHVDWTRTDFQIPARGGAVTNGFDLAKIAGRAAPARPIAAPEKLWQSLRYFLERIVPVAEDAGVN